MTEPRTAWPVPDVDDVAPLLPTRLKSRYGGASRDTFDETTRPTGEQVTGLLLIALSRVKSRVGGELEPDDHPAATFEVTLFAAMLVELTYFPEQVREGNSPYPELKALYDDGMAALLAAAGEPVVAERRYRRGTGRITGPVREAFDELA